MFFSVQLILIFYFLYFTVCFNLDFSFDSNNFAKYLGLGWLFAWPPSLDFWIWRVTVSRACLRGLNPFQERGSYMPHVLDHLMDHSFHFHNDNLKAVAPLTGMELRTPYQDSFIPEVRQLFTDYAASLEVKMRNIVPGRLSEGPHVQHGEETSATFCKMVSAKEKDLSSYMS